MTFVAMLLSSLYDLEETSGWQRCIQHPFGKHSYVVTPATEYAADMNIVLVYYQALDDLNDDHNIAAGEKSRLLEKYLPEVKTKCPRQFNAIESSLKQLSAIEKTVASIMATQCSTKQIHF